MTDKISEKEVIEKYDSAIRAYRERIFPAFPNYLRDQRMQHLPLLERLLGLYIFSSYLLDTHAIPNEEKYTPLKTLFVKNSLSLFGIHSCLENLLITEGSILLRSLFETHLNVRLILQDRDNIDERLALFNEFRFAEQWNNYQANLKLKREEKLSENDFRYTFTQDLITRVEANYNSIKSNYHPSKPYHWAWKIFKEETGNRNPSIALIADKLGMSFDYVKVYGALSISVHNSPSLLNLVGQDGQITLAPRPSSLIRNIGELAISYAISVIEDVTGYLKLGEPREISTYLSCRYEE